MPFVLTNCKTGNINVNFYDTEYSVILRKSEREKKITYIRLPKKLRLENGFLTNRMFKRIVYSYKINKDKCLGLVLYQKKNDSLSRISNNKKKAISAKESLEYIYYTRHFIDSTKSIQQQFKPYIEKMLAENKDTLHIGTVDEFKQQHKELFEKLTKNDSISIQFLDGKKLGERITVPVAW